MTLPEYSQIRYAKLPLKLVLCQVRFPLQLRVMEPGFVADFQEQLVQSYPVPTREQQASFQLSAAGMTVGPNETVFRFTDRAGAWSIVLGETALTLEARGYSDIKELLSRFQEMIAVAQATLGLRECTRLGIRYINEFRNPKAVSLADWRDQFRPEFLGFAASLFDEPVEKTVQQVQVTRPDGVLVIHHGLLQGTTVLPLPSTPPAPAFNSQEPFYLLDLDYSDSNQVPLDLEKSLVQLRAYHNVIYRFFRWTLTERLHAALEPHHAPAS